LKVQFRPKNWVKKKKNAPQKGGEEADGRGRKSNVLEKKETTQPVVDWGKVLNRAPLKKTKLVDHKLFFGKNKPRLGGNSSGGGERNGQRQGLGGTEKNRKGKLPRQVEWGEKSGIAKKYATFAKTTVGKGEGKGGKRGFNRNDGCEGKRT